MPQQPTSQVPATPEPGMPVRVRRMILREPLFRLLLINLAAGVTAAALLVGGLLLLDPYGLRSLILADRSPATALALLGFGFVITLGSAAMGTAIMALGGRTGRPRGRRTAVVAEPAPVRVSPT
jgi:hypothetical protein